MKNSTSCFDGREWLGFLRHFVLFIHWFAFNCLCRWFSFESGFASNLGISICLAMAWAPYFVHLNEASFSLFCFRLSSLPIQSKPNVHRNSFAASDAEPAFKNVPLSIYLYQISFASTLHMLVWITCWRHIHWSLPGAFVCLWHRSPNLELNLIYRVCNGIAAQAPTKLCGAEQHRRKVQIIFSDILCEARVIQIFQPLAMKWSFYMWCSMTTRNDVVHTRNNCLCQEPDRLTF